MRIPISRDTYDVLLAHERTIVQLQDRLDAAVFAAQAAFQVESGAAHKVMTDIVSRAAAKMGAPAGQIASAKWDFDEQGCYIETTPPPQPTPGGE